MRRSLLTPTLLLLLTGCPEPARPPAVNRCEVDLQASGFFAFEGAGSSARVLSEGEPGIGGQSATASTGDVLLANDRIRVVIERAGRVVAPHPYGGNVIDADLVRPEGDPGRDHFGELGLLYSFGRTLRTTAVEVLADGADGGPAVVAATGEDAVNDWLNVRNLLTRVLGSGLQFVVDSEKPLPLRMTTYYVLSPKEARVRVLTAFCNDGEERVVTTVGDMVDRGGSVEILNPAGCAQGMGGGGSCLIESSSWFGYQGDGVAYGYRSYRLDEPNRPDQNGMLTVSGVSATLAGGQGSSGVLSWLDPEARERPGRVTIAAGGQQLFLRDFVIGRDLGEVASTLTFFDGVEAGFLEAKVVDAGGQAVPAARVAVQAADGRMVTLLVTDEGGSARAWLPVGTYRLQAAKRGYALGANREVQVGPKNNERPELSLGGSRRLTVHVRDPLGRPMPAKVTVLCTTRPCSTESREFDRFYEGERLPSEVAAIDFVPPGGTLELMLPPAAYEVVVSRGPEYSIWPDRWPAGGQKADLGAGPAELTAVLAQVVDSSGWMSSDLHLHAVNSPDSAIRNEYRVLNFAAEGVDVLCSTDHDYLTDFGPAITALGAAEHLASMVGAEITPFDWGHYNAFPLQRDPASVNGGAFDWAGGEGPTLRPAQLFAAVRAASPEAVIQMNHPRGPIGSLTLLKVDTASLASHAPPESFRMEPAEDATPTDARLFNTGFDAIEVMTGTSLSSFQVFNDWMTFLSRGTVRTATATSDSHNAFVYQGGYPRTYVATGGADRPGQFDATAFAAALKRQQAFNTTGPFLRVTARALDAGGQPVGPELPIGGTVSLASGQALQLSVEVQAPEWMSLGALELYSHADGREALNGEGNHEWPEARVLQRKPIAVSTLEPIVVNGQTFRRIRVRDQFVVTPTADTWLVVMVRPGAGARDLFPLTFNGVDCSTSGCTARPVPAFAFTNAFLVDADGSGVYDRFPLKSQRSLRLPPPESPPRRWTAEEIDRAVRAMIEEHR